MTFLIILHSIVIIFICILMFFSLATDKQSQTWIVRLMTVVVTFMLIATIFLNWNHLLLL